MIETRDRNSSLTSELDVFEDTDTWSEGSSCELQSFSFSDIGQVLSDVRPGQQPVQDDPAVSVYSDEADESYISTDEADLCGFSFNKVEGQRQLWKPELECIFTASTKLTRFNQNQNLSFDDGECPSPRDGPSNLGRKRVASLPLLSEYSEEEDPADDSFCSVGTRDGVLQVLGRARIKSTMTCVVSKSWAAQHGGANKCYFQWYRVSKDSHKTKIVGAKYSKYTVTIEDLDHRLQVVAAPVMEGGNVGPSSYSVPSDIVTQQQSQSTGDLIELASGVSLKTDGMSHGLRSSGMRRYSAQGLVFSGTNVQNSANVQNSEGRVQIYGEGQVGTALVVAAPTWNDGSGEALESRKCRIQWLRGMKAGNGQYVFTKIHGAKTPHYMVTDEDLGCRLRVVAAPLLPDGQIGKAYTALSRRIWS